MNKRVWLPIAALAFSASSITAQTNRIQVAFNGQAVKFGSVQPVQDGGSTLIPLRPMLARTGGQIFWERDTNSVIVTGRNNLSARIFPGKNTIQSGGNEITLEVAPRIVRGQTMVPVEFFQRVFGMYTQENLANGSVTLQTQTQNGDNQVRVLRTPARNRARALRRTDIAAYNRNRVLSNANYMMYLQRQDYNRYLNERAAWQRAYANYRNSVPVVNGGFGGYTVINPSVANTVAPTVNPYILFLYNQDFNAYMTNRSLWQNNYQAYINTLNQNSGAFQNDALTQEQNWQNYLQARDTLLQQLQNDPVGNTPPR